MDSSILTIIFSFFLAHKLYKSSMQIMHLISHHLLFLGSVDIGAHLVVTSFEKESFNFYSYFQMSGLYIKPYIGHGQIFHLRAFSTDQTLI